MATSEKFGRSSGASGKHSDSTKAREFVKETYRKTGGRPAPGLERVYGEYLRYERDKAPTHKDRSRKS
jgi:hypothetical protein